MFSMHMYRHLFWIYCLSFYLVTHEEYVYAKIHVFSNFFGSMLVVIPCLHFLYSWQFNFERRQILVSYVHLTRFWNRIELYCYVIILSTFILAKTIKLSYLLTPVIKTHIGYPKQYLFQNPATPVMEGIINLHHDIVFILFVVIGLVLWLLFAIVFYFKSDIYVQGLFFNKYVIMLDRWANSVYVDVYYRSRISIKDVVLSNYGFYFSFYPKMLGIKSKYRSKYPRQHSNWYHGTTLEIIWTTIPALILIAIALPSFALLYGMDDLSRPVITLKAIGNQWYWSYEYSDELTFNTNKKIVNFNSIISDYLSQDNLLSSSDKNRDLVILKKIFINRNKNIQMKLIAMRKLSAVKRCSLFHEIINKFGCLDKAIIDKIAYEMQDIHVRNPMRPNNCIKLSNLIIPDTTIKQPAFVNVLLARFKFKFIFEKNTEFAAFKSKLVRKAKLISENMITSDEISRNIIRFDSYMIADDDLLESKQLFRLLSVDNYVCLPIKTHIRILVTANDVLHSWAIPALGLKLDACPGRLNQTGLYIKREGDYYGQCSEICGVNHAFMPIHIKAVSLRDYLLFLQETYLKLYYPLNKNYLLTNFYLNLILVK